jgi:hypothetical protein
VGIETHLSLRPHHLLVPEVAWIARYRLGFIGAVVAANLAGLSVHAHASARDSTANPRQVHLYRDSVGMAHLYADREEDAFYGIGYATGEDRLGQVLTCYVDSRTPTPSTLPRRSAWARPEARPCVYASTATGASPPIR